MASKKTDTNPDSGDGNGSDSKATPVKVVHVTESSTLEDKLQWLDQEVRSLQQFCSGKGFNPWEVEESAQPLLGVVDQWKRGKWKSTAVKVSVVVVLLLTLYYYDPAYRMMWATARLSTIKVLPYWDWSVYYDQECLIENPYYEGSQLTLGDCEVCESLDTIDRIQNVSHAVMTEDYLKRDIPIIVTDAMDSWPAMELFSVAYFQKLFSTDDTLKEVPPCMFASNIRVKFNTPQSVLNRAEKGLLTNWYAHWEHCDKVAGKAMRQFYQRPYFVPPMVEISERNWLFLASSYKGKNSKPADMALPLMMFAQVKGDTKVTLIPRDPCKDICTTLYGTLHPGEILVTTDYMWLLDYLPLNAQETISLGIGGFFD